MTVRNVGAVEAVRLAREGYRVVDVREPAEWQAGHVAGAMHLPLAAVAGIVDIVPDRTTPILVHCAAGARSARAAEWLAGAGYTDVANLDGTLAAWRAAGGGWTPGTGQRDAASQDRYARQMALAEIGPEGQSRLRAARVLVIGAGGLGSPVALYLAASGVGTLGLVDDDLVDASNLQRQVLHATDRVGTSKVDSARQTLLALNPDVDVVVHRERLTATNAERLIAPYDVIVDGTDNLDARYALNDAAVRLGKPVVHGSVYRWEGLLTTFVPGDGPCYVCLHPDRPPDELVLDCDVAGVLGVLPGIVGTLQAAEALKLVLEAGTPLVGRLVLVDALRGTFDEISVSRDPSCAACGAAAAEADTPIATTA